MNIVRMEASHIAVPYIIPYSIGRARIPIKNALVLKLITDAGIVGYGEGGAFGDPGGEVRAILRWLDTAGRSLLANGLLQNPADIDSILKLIPYSVLACAFDHALHDIMGKARNVPLYQLLSGGGASNAKTRIGVARSVKGTSSGSEIAESALRLRESGYKLITVGVGLGSTPAADIARFAAVRGAVGNQMPLEVDANGGWGNSTIAIKTISELEKYGLEAAEQPVPNSDLEGLAAVTAAVNTTIIAHGSARDPRGAWNVIHRRAANVIAITLPWYGGLLWGRRVADMASAAGLRCSLASGHPLGIGTAALGHLAASTPTIQEPIGYGAPRERLVDDILKEDIPFSNGEVSMLQGPGLGVEIDDDKLNKYRVGDPLVIVSRGQIRMPGS